MSFRKNAAIALMSAASLSLSIMSFLVLSPASAAERLVNGGFESGSSGWDTTWTVTSCPPRSGSGVMELAVTSDGMAFGQTQTSPLPAGLYVFRGYARVLEALPASARGTIRSLNTQAFDSDEIALTTSYAPWTAEFEFDGATGFRVGVVLLTDDPVTVCLDDLSLEGPIVAQPSPTPSHTATATATATPTVPTPTATAVTTTPVPATSTAVGATSTSAPTLTFINGGFEESTAGWRTQGGDLDAVGNPRLSGSRAGRFVSSTAGTKFVYQTVAIDPALSYEFQGAVMTEGAVGEAFLRIAWYTSSDGSGSQMATVDSPSSVRADSGGFVTLTTGPIVPPASALSARLRVVLSPAGAAPATVYLDDFSLTATAPATATATVAPSATATAASIVTPTLEAAVAGVMEPGHTPPAGGLVSEASSVRATAASSRGVAPVASSTPRRSMPSAAGLDSAQAPSEEDGPLWPYLAALPLAAGLAAAGYYYSKRRAAI